MIRVCFAVYNRPSNRPLLIVWAYLYINFPQKTSSPIPLASLLRRIYWRRSAMQNEAIRTLLKTLHCNGILTHWEELIDVAALQSMNNLVFLQKLLETEAAYRETRALLYRLDVA